MHNQLKTILFLLFSHQIRLSNSGARKCVSVYYLIHVYVQEEIALSQEWK